MTDVLDVHLGGDLALAGGALPEDVADLGDAVDPAAADHLDQDLVAERAEDRAGDRASAHHEVAAHRVRDAPHDAGNQAEPEQLRSAR